MAQHAWMAKPHVPEPCLDGLQYLVVLDKFIVKQKKEMIELVTGFETKNKYNVLNDAGQQIYFAQEESSTVQRLFGGPGRAFAIQMKNSEGHDCLIVSRPMNLFGHCGLLFPCCSGTASVLTVTGKDGSVLGYVRQRNRFCRGEFLLVDASENPILRIEGPSMACRIRFMGSDIEFKVFSVNDGSEIGKLSKRWAGFLQESFTDADTFEAKFPVDLPVSVKALLLGATFLIDFVFFETKQKNNR